MEKKLLLLGLLRVREAHGYQLNETIEELLGDQFDLKKPTMYDLLKKMTDDGWISAREERQGHRPPRRVYSLTELGEDAFQELVRDSLATYRPAELHGDAGLLFLEAVTPAQALALLKKRRWVIESLAKDIEEHPRASGSRQLIIDHQKIHLAGELVFLDEVIERVGKELS